MEDEAHIIYANGTYRGDDSVGRLMHDCFCTKKADEMNDVACLKSMEA